MRSVRDEEDLELEPHADEVPVAELLHAIDVALQANLAELARVIGEVRGDAPSPVERAVAARAGAIAVDPVDAEPGDPRPLEAVQDLRVRAVILEDFRGEELHGAVAIDIADETSGLVVPPHPLVLERHERPALVIRRGLPFVKDVQA